LRNPQFQEFSTINYPFKEKPIENNLVNYFEISDSEFFTYDFFENFIVKNNSELVNRLFVFEGLT
jgi:hypothetical protein